MAAESESSRSTPPKGLGVVIIGRNEAARLGSGLESVLQVPIRIYVDSGSTDESVAVARRAGADIVELDPGFPFTAARGRNEGFERLLALDPQVEFVLFIDGDCVLQAGWIEEARALFDQRPEVAAICGRRRERYPDASPYNRLTDIEWDEAVGDTEAFGGDVMMRVSAFREVDGYDPTLIAGEDPELSLRLRLAGYTLVRLPSEMTLHDIDLLSFGPWWRRQVRSGHAYAEVVWLQGARRDVFWARQLGSILVWCGALPLLSVMAAWPTQGWSLLLLALLGVLWLRIAMYARTARGLSLRVSTIYATGCVIGKFAQLRGVLEFAWRRLTRRGDVTLIDYRGSNSSSNSTDAPFSSRNAR